MSASIINTNSNTKIFSTNNINKIEVSNENIIQSDSEFREVIKKGYLLSQINLTSVPTIIQDALNKLIDDAKDATLNDDLIQNLKQSLESLDDGIYKKTYIDNTITYLENLLTSKVNLETVASIADNKIAKATQNLATTVQVQNLSSRIGNSETEINNVKNTINTKDTARALQMEEMEARVNETFAGYSDAIDLYVDEEGNVKSQKIETLSTNIGLQLQEVNKLIIDNNNDWSAKSTKLITSPTGAITGYSFIDGSNLKSTFDINADNFKIANSYNSYTPFSIVGTSLFFNGKVAFTNVSGTDGVITTVNLQDAVHNNVTSIDGGKIVTNSINADKINTNGLIAENISASEIIGKTISGAVINGAVINGAVVRASYLDLDGELEVLTNYHITPAMHSANPSLYTDAVYLPGNNEYRIPSISMIKEDITSKNISVANSVFDSKIRSYNSANVGHNNKCVKIKPNIHTGNFVFLELLYSWSNSFLDTNFYQGTTDRFELYFAGYYLGVFYYDCLQSHFTDNYLYRNGLIVHNAGDDYNTSIYSFTNNGFDFSIEIENINLENRTGHLSLKFRINDVNNASSLVFENFNDTTKGLFHIKNLGQGTIHFSHEGESGAATSYTATCYTNQNVYVNNMI